MQALVAQQDIIQKLSIIFQIYLEEKILEYPGFWKGKKENYVPKKWKKEV